MVNSVKYRIRFENKIWSIYVVLIYFVFLSDSPLFAQFHQFKFENLSTREGLSQNTVTSIEQDKYGFMWFGTFNGLNRFDGYEFKTYYKSDEIKNSLSSSRCTDIAIDSAGNLWIYTADELVNRYNYITDDFTRLIYNDIPDEVAKKFEQRRQENILTYKNHKFRFFYNRDRTFTYIDLNTNDSTNKIVNTENPYGLRDNYVIDLFIDKYHSLWVGSFSSGIYYADLQRKKFSHFLLPGNNAGENNIRAIYQDDDGTLWLGSRNEGVIKYEPLKKNYTYYKHNEASSNSLVNNDVRKIYKDRKGIFWIGTKGGVSRFDPKTGKFTNILKGSGYDFRYYVFYINEDYLGNIWIATFNGLSKYDEKTNKVIYYGKEDGVISNNTIRFIFEDNNNLWLGTEVGGLTLLKRKPVFGNEKEKFESFTYLNDPKNSRSISDNRLYSVCRDEFGNMWFGTGGGLNKYNPATGDFDRIGIAHGLSSDMILGILSDYKGNLWVSHKRGLSKINILNKSVVNYSVRDGLQDNEFNEDAYFRNPRTGELFFGGPKGYNSFFPDSIVSNSEPPKLMITNFYIQGEPVNIGDTINGRVILEKNIILTKEITLTYQEKSFAIAFAGLNFANPLNHKYAYMLKGFDKDWILTDAKMRRASYTNLSSGTYTFMVKGYTSDGVESTESAELKIIVLPPYWEQWWFRTLVILGVVSLAAYLIFNRINRLEIKNSLLEEKVNQRTHELRESNEKIKSQFHEISEQNKTIIQKNEEISVQAELLEEQKSKIEKAYNELELHRNNLERLIEERTKELIQAKEKAEESDRLKTSFLSNLSHEIRTPLNAILGFTTFIFDDSFSLEEKQDFKTIVDNNCNSLLDLIEEIVDYAIIEAANVELDISQVKISDIIEEMKRVYEVEFNRQQFSIIEKKELLFKVFLDPALENSEIITDKKRIFQVLSYLVNNAIKFTQKGFIEIGCKVVKESNLVQFYVKDTGIGISPENQKHIFQRFRKIEPNNAQVFRGIGLGLTISEQLIQLLGGEINVESEVGKGSTFYFNLPKGKTEKKPIPVIQKQINSIEIPDLSNAVVLIAEDDPGNYIYLERLIKKTGAQVLHAINGKQVIDIIKNNPQVSIILMDIKMPELDGIEALQTLKKMGIAIPVVAQTAYAFADEIEKIKKAGFDGLITKPIVISNLYQVLPQVLSS